MIRSICHDVEVSPTTFAELLQMDGVHEELTLRSTFGFMAFHGGGLEALTDIVAREAAAQSNASYYAVIHPDGDPPHLPSTRFQPDESPTMRSFFEHVDVVITIVRAIVLHLSLSPCPCSERAFSSRVFDATSAPF